MGRLVCCLAVAVVAVFGVQSAFRPASALPPPNKPVIATLDLAAIYDKWSAVKEFTDALEGEKKAQEADLAKLEDRIKEKQAAAEKQEKGTKERQKLEEEIAALQAKSKTKMDNWNTTVKTKLNEGIAEFYERIEVAIAEYAAARHITLVIKKGGTKLKDEPDASAALERRIALYADPACDITNEVLEALEAR